MAQYDKGPPPLAGKLILVPPARPEANPLLTILERAGARTVEFPHLEVAPPADFRPLDAAVGGLAAFDWLVFSGSNCVVNFLDRMGAAGRELPGRIRLAAIGTGATGRLRQAGLSPDYIPRRHTAAEVAEGLGEVAGLRFLLIRVAGASPALPETLRRLGAKVREIAGYRMLVRSDREAAEQVFASRPDALALANPSAVRFLLQGLAQAGLQPAAALRDTPIVAVGPATAQAARANGLSPTLTSQGHIADLAANLIALLA